MAYVSDPLSVLHLLRFSGDLTVRNRFANFRDPISIGAGSFAYVPFSLLSTHRWRILNSKLIMKHWLDLTFPKLMSRLSDFGFSTVDVLFINSVYFYRLLDLVPHKVSVYRVADWNKGFSETPDVTWEFEKKIIQRVDLVISPAHTTISDHITPLRPKSVEYVPNGVELADFSVQGDSPAEFQHIEKPIALYVGVIDHRVDLDLLEYLARSHDHVSFVLVGDVRVDVSGLASYRNIQFLGPRDYADVSRYMKHAAVGLLLQNRAYPATDYFNPLKLYQYLACQLPVVGMRWRELTMIAPPIFLADSSEEFSKMLSEALNRNESNTERYREFLKSYEWSSIFTGLSEMLQLRLNRVDHNGIP